MMWLLLSAWAGDCPDLAVRLEAAWSAFDDAELGQTAEQLDAALADLGCQSRVISADELRQLFLLDATAALSNGDQDGAVYSVIRAVVVAPSLPVDPRFGPQVAALVQTWSERLGAGKLKIDNKGTNTLFVDGREVPPGARFEGVEGEHVLQWVSTGGLHTEVRDMVGIVAVDTGQTNLAIVRGAPSEPPVVATPPNPPARPDRSPRPLSTSPAIWGTGLAVAALGGGAVIAGWRAQEGYQDNPYDADAYNGCSQADACYDQARADRIRGDASLIRALYGTGYGLLGAGAVLFGVGLGVHPAHSSVSVSLSLPLPVRLGR